MKGKTNLKIVVTKIMMTRFNQNREIGLMGCCGHSFVTKSNALCTCCILLLKFTRVSCGQLSDIQWGIYFSKLALLEQKCLEKISLTRGVMRTIEDQ
jgi:hypothetical protein